MKNFRPLYLVLALMFFFVYGCERQEETKQPVADFSFDPTTDIAVGDVVTFTNLSTDANSSNWDFGDGTSSEAQHPTHKYNEAGEYRVTLIVKNKDLQDDTFKDLIVISPVTACFTFDPSTAAVGENVTFTNCSEGADSYEWDFDSDGIGDATTANPEHAFDATGTFDVTLTAMSGSSIDEVVHSITIQDCEVIEIDPYTYDPGPVWNKYYENIFDTDDGSFDTGSDLKWSASISDGEYIITNSDADNPWYFWTDKVVIPDESQSYDLEVAFYTDYDNVTQGQGLFWALDPDAFDFNFFRWTPYAGGYYTIGNSVDGSWLSTETGFDIGGIVDDYNWLTIRKYKNKYYFFINGEFVFEKPFISYFGEKFGFYVGADSKMSNDQIQIYTLVSSCSRKSGGMKINKNYDPKPGLSNTGKARQGKATNSLK